MVEKGEKCREKREQVIGCDIYEPPAVFYHIWENPEKSLSSCVMTEMDSGFTNTIKAFQETNIKVKGQPLIGLNRLPY